MINSSSPIDFAKGWVSGSESFLSKLSGDFNSDSDLVVVTHPSFPVAPYLLGLLTWRFCLLLESLLQYGVAFKSPCVVKMPVQIWKDDKPIKM